MKTIKDKGNVYQLGAVYEFSDDGKMWCLGVLEAIQPKSNYPYRTYSGHGFKLIRACEVKVGTIEEAPVELIDGECYQFLNPLNIWSKGFFIAEYGMFSAKGGHVFASECSNIKLLVVENS